jgi:hypothetical protein
MGKAGFPFEVNLPDRWKETTVYTYQGPDDSGVQHNISLVVDRETTAPDLKTYAAERRANLLATLQGIDILKEEERTMESGYPAYELVYKWIPVEGTVVYQKMLFVLVGRVVCTFSGNFSKKTIKTIGVEFDRIASSFAPLD